MTKTKVPPAKSKSSPLVKNKQGTSTSASIDRKAIFIEAYIANGGNGQDAAIKAGYSAKTAGQQAWRILNEEPVKAALAARQKHLAKKFELTTEDVLRQLAQIVYADPRKMYDTNGSLLPPGDWPDEVAACIASVEVHALFEGFGEDRKQTGHVQKVKLWDKNAAIDKAMRHLGQYEKDNRQKSPFQDMDEATLDRFIARKQKEAEDASKLH